MTTTFHTDITAPPLALRLALIEYACKRWQGLATIDPEHAIAATAADFLVLSAGPSHSRFEALWPLGAS